MNKINIDKTYPVNLILVGRDEIEKKFPFIKLVNLLKLNVQSIFVVIIFSLMSGKLNKEEQVQVVIRLKPVSKELINTRSVYVSDEQEKTLVV